MKSNSPSLQLAPFEIRDVERLSLLANNWEIAKNLTDQFPHPYTPEHAKSFIEMTQKHKPTRIMSIRMNGDLIGAVGIHPQEDVFKKNAELGYWVAQEYWGKGVASFAVKEMVKYGFRHFDVDRIFARPFGSNAASQAVLLKTGFVKEAEFKNTIFKNGAYEDELFFAVYR